MLALMADILRRLSARSASQVAEFSVVESRLKQIEHESAKREPHYDILDDMHANKAELRHARRSEHNGRSFWNDKRAEHPQDLIEDRALPLHDSVEADRIAARDFLIKDHDNDKLYNYTAKQPIIHDNPEAF